MLRSQLIVVLFILISSCMGNKISASYEYADGSANLYLLSEKELQYLPIKPEESSTGFYSGGDPKTVSVTAAQYNALKDLFDDALENKAIHITDRVKTSGMISMMGSDKQQCILQPHCAEMKAIEAALKQTLGN